MSIKKHPSLRILSAFLAISLIHTNIAWALDPRAKIKKDKLAFESMGEARAAMSPQETTSFEKRAQDSVLRNQAIQNLVEKNPPLDPEVSNPAYDLKSSNTKLIDYLNDALSSKKTTPAASPKEEKKEEKAPEKQPAGPLLELRSEVPTLTNAKILKVTYVVDGQERSRVFHLDEGENALQILEAGSNGMTSTLAFKTTLDLRPPVVTWAAEPPVLTREETTEVHYVSDGMEKSRAFSLKEGINTITVTEQDAAGNVATLTRQVTLDTTAPSLEVTSRLPALTNQSKLFVEYTVDGAPKTRDFELSEGANELTLRETDAAGNETVRTLLVTRDTRMSPINILSDLPAVTRQPGLDVIYESDGIRRERVFLLKEGANEITIDAVNAAGNRSTITRTVTLDTIPPAVALSAEPPALTNQPQMEVRYSADGVVKKKLFALKEGKNTIAINETDIAGNSTVVTRELVLDTTAPSVLISAEPPTLTNKPALSLPYTVDGQARTKTFTLVEGANTIEIEETDAAGNRSVLTREVTLDTLAPEVTLVSEPPTLTQNPTLFVAYTLDGQLKTQTFSLAEGLNQIRISETDAAGNSRTLTRTLTLDTIAPSVLLATEPPTLTNKPELTLPYTVDGQPKTKAFTLAEGTNVLTLTETDAAGNQMRLDRTVTLDTIAPKIVLTGQIPAVTNASEVAVGYTSDGQAKIKTFSLKEGDNTLLLEETDAAGNTAKRTLNVTRDAQAPEIRLLIDIPQIVNRPDMKVVYISDGIQKEKAYSLQEGENTLTISETDDAGNLTTLTRTVTLDTIAPAVALSSEPPVLTNKPALIVNYTSDGMTKSKDYVLKEGVNTIAITETDAAGNQTVLNRTLTLDTTAPAVVLSFEPPVLTNKPALTVSYVSDGVSKSKDFPLKEGENTITITESDKAGNQTVLNRTLTLDTIAPAVLLTAEPPDLTNKPTLTVNYTSDGQSKSQEFHLTEGQNTISITEIDAAGNQSQSTRLVTLDTAPPQIVITGELPALTNQNALMVVYTVDGVAKSASFSLKEGVNDLSITASDAAGNISERLVRIVLDTQAPQITLLTDIPDLTNKPTLTVNYTADGVARSKDFTLKEGQNTITFMETDTAGNPTTVSRTLTLDTIAPAVILAAEPPSLTNKPALTVSYTSDGVTKSKDFMLKEGTNTISITETDAAGNPATVTRTLVLDTIPPAVLLSAEPPTLTNKPVLTVNYTSDGEARSKDFTLKEGANTISITETDAAGNPTTVTRTLTLDTIAPAVVLSLEPPVITNKPLLTVNYTSDGVAKSKDFDLKEGQNTIVITETDAAGNPTTITRTLTLDTIAPAVSLTAEPPVLTNKPALKVSYTSDGQTKSKDFEFKEGLNTITISETDAAGNQTVLSRTLTLDTAAPAVILATEPPTLTNKSALTVDYTSDGIAKSKDFTLKEGQNTIVITETDTAGNQTVLNHTLTLDTIAPAVLLTAEPLTLTNKPALKVSYTSDGQAKSKDFTLKEGQNTISIAETDAAGNATTLTRTLTLDTIAPSIVLAAEPPTLTNQPALTVNYTSDGTAKSKNVTLKEGENTISISETDAAGNQTTLTRIITLDTIAPTIILSAEPPTLTNKPALTASYTSDGQTKFKDFALKEGTNTISITETDAAGNPTTLNRTLTLDTIAPAIVLTVEPPSLTNKPTLTVSYTSDGQAKFKDFTLKEGANTITVTETDAAGNQTTLDRTLTLDTIAPAVVLSAEPPSLTNKPTLTVNYASDGQTKSKDFTLKEGINTITITETDAAGNQTTVSRILTLDTIPPAVVLSAEPPVLTNNPALTLNYTSDGQTQSKDFTLKEGTNTISITETDPAGNPTTLTRTLTLDTIPPQVILAAEPPTLTNKPDLKLTYTSDNQPKSKDFTLTEGQNTLSITETDPAGNPTTVTRTLTLDTIPPQVVLTAPLVTLVKNSAYTIAYTSDGESKSKNFELKPGANILTVTESDAAGNTSVYTYEVTYKLPPTIVLSNPVPTTTDSNTITVNYNSDGADKSKTFTLNPGENIITLSETDILNQTTEKSYWITSTSAPSQTQDSNAVTLTTSTGDKVSYNGNQIQNIQTAQGDLLNNINLTSTGTIQDAQILLADGSVQLYDNGQVIGYQRPDKTRVFYKDGKVQKILSPSGDETLFSYLSDSILAESAATRIVYELDGSLKNIVSKTTATTSVFDHGVLQSVSFNDGSTVLYELTTTQDGLTHLKAQNSSIHAQDLPFLEAWVNPQTKQYTQILTPSGMTLKFDAQGSLVSSHDSEGRDAAFNITTSALGNLLAARLDQGGVTSSYDSRGRLSTVTVNGLKVHYKANSDAIDYLESPDGSRIDEIRLDAEGNIQDAVITTATNEERTYVDGHLVKITQTDDSEFNFIFDADKAQSVLNDILTRDKLHYTFSYAPDAITATLDPGILPSQDTVIQMKYDAALNLKSAIKHNDEVIRFAQGGRIAEILTPSEAPKVFAYSSDGSYAVTQGFNQSFYDTAGNLLKVVVAPHDGAPDTLEVAYKYGKIREVYRVSGEDRELVFKYSYELNPGSSDTVQIEDLEEKSVKTYRDGVLTQSLGTESSILTTFSYASGSDKIEKVVLTRLGRDLHTYLYAYDGANTIVTDEAGVVRTYGADQKLTTLEKSDALYAYTYQAGLEDEEVVQEELIRRTLSDGSRVYYSNGVPARQDHRPDGAVITDIVLSADREVSDAVMTFADGTKRVFKNQQLVEEVFVDGVRFEYTDGMLARIIGADGSELKITYGKDARGALDSVWVEEAAKRFQYDFSGNLIGLVDDSGEYCRIEISSDADGKPVYAAIKDGIAHKLAPDTGGLKAQIYMVHQLASDRQVITTNYFDHEPSKELYGDGRDGTVRVTSTLALDRDMYYESLAIDEGAVLVTNNHKIFVKGTLVNQGTITADGLGSAGGTGGSSPATEAKRNGKPGVSVSGGFGGGGGSGGGGGRYAWQPGRYSSSGDGGVGGSVRLSQNVPNPLELVGLNLSLLGGAGGGGGGMGMSSGGNGGSGGGVAIIYAEAITGNGKITANGSEGEAGTQIVVGSGGGGGGGGGLVYLMTSTRTDNAVSAAGGKGGAAGRQSGIPEGDGTAGSKGSPGQVVRYELDTLKFEVAASSLKLTALDRVKASVNSEGKILQYSLGSLQAASSSASVSQYSYKYDSQNRLERVYVHEDGRTLDYDAAGNLLGIRMDSAVTTEQIKSLAIHTNQAGSSVDPSTDKDPDTALQAGMGTIYSQYDFPSPQTVTRFNYKAEASGYSYGWTNNGSSAMIYLEYLDAATNQWKTVPDSYQRDERNSDGNMTNSYVSTNGMKSLDVSISGVKAVRVVSSVGGYSNNGGGSANGTTKIHEFDYEIADQSYLSFSRTDSGYSFTGPETTLTYDSAGKLLAANTPVDMSAEAQALGSRIQEIATMPHVSQAKPLLAGLMDSWTTVFNDVAMNAGDVAIQEYTSSGILETQTHADHTVTLFENNRASKVLSENGEVLLEYRYDSEGHPSRVYLKKARETLPNEVAKASENIETQRAAALLELAKQKNLAYESIESQASAQRQALLAQLGLLQEQFNSASGTKVSGKKAKGQKGDVLNEIGNAIDGVRGALVDLDRQEADAYANLDAQVLRVSDQIKADAQRAVESLAVQETQFKYAILKQEVSPLIYDAYRRTLGRDPSTAEYDEWIGKVAYESGSENPADLQKTTDGKYINQALAEFLASSSELAERTAYVQGIKTRITADITQYLTLSTEDRKTFAANLGLHADQLIALSDADAARVINYINTRSLHFGQSAFLSLESLLDQKGISYARDDLAVRCILIDILTGVISPLDDGDLVLSVHALNTVAQGYGLSLSGANLTWEDLQGIYQTSPDSRIIAHINGNHYVIITSIDKDKVTYIDPGIGKDKHNESLTVTKEGFLKAWQGNVTASSQILQDARLKADSKVSLMSVAQSQGVRGAFWGSFLGLLSWVFAFIPPVSMALRIASIAVSIVEKDWISAITSTLGVSTGGGSTIGSQIQTALSSAFHGVTQALGTVGNALSAIGHGIIHVYENVTGFIDKAINFLPGIGSHLEAAAIRAGGATIGAQVVNYALNTGITMGLSKGLGALGIAPEAAGLIGSLASATFTGALKGDTTKIINGSQVLTTQAQHIQSSVQQTLILNQVGKLGLELGLDAQFSSIVGMSLGAIQGQQIELGNNFDLSEAFTNIRPDFTTSLAIYGIDKISSKLGVDPLIGRAFALPLMAANPLGGGANVLTRSIPDLIRESVVHGALELGIQYTAKQISDNPLLEGLSRNLLTGALGMVLGQNSNLIESVQRFLAQSVQGLINKIQTGEYQILSNSQGPLRALEMSLTDVLNERSAEEVHRLGGLADVVAGRARMTMVEGKAVKEVQITNEQSIYLNPNNTLAGVKTKDRLDFGIYDFSSDGKLVLADGISTQKDPNTDYAVRHEIHNGSEISMSYGSAENPMITIIPQTAVSTPLITPEGLMVTGMLHMPGYAMSINIDEWAAGLRFINFQNFNSRSPLSLVPPAIHIKDVGTPTRYVLFNGVNPDFSNYGEVPPYFDGTLQGSFVDTLVANNVADKAEITSVALYDDPTLLPDLVNWYYDAKGTVNSVTHRVRDGLDDIQLNQTTTYTALAYSGAGSPLLKALGNLSNENDQPFPVSSVILVGAPFLEDGAKVDRPYDTLINVYGSNDLFLTDKEKTIQRINGIYQAVKEMGTLNPLIKQISDRIDFAAEKAEQSVGFMSALAELIIHKDVRGFGDWVLAFMGPSEMLEAAAILTGASSVPGLQFAKLLNDKYESVKDTLQFSVPTIRKEFEGFKTVYNIQLNGVGHTDYFISPSERPTLPANSIKFKAEKFIANISKFANDSVRLKGFLGDFAYSNGAYQIDLERVIL